MKRVTRSASLCLRVWSPEIAGSLAPRGRVGVQHGTIPYRFGTCTLEISLRNFAQTRCVKFPGKLAKRAKYIIHNAKYMPDKLLVCANTSLSATLLTSIIMS